jgi:hypothetical protein
MKYSHLFVTAIACAAIATGSTAEPYVAGPGLDLRPTKSQFFYQVDRNDDGLISIEEYSVSFSVNGWGFRESDLNGDGSIDRGEASQAYFTHQDHPDWFQSALMAQGAEVTSNPVRMGGAPAPARKGLLTSQAENPNRAQIDAARERRERRDERKSE